MGVIQFISILLLFILAYPGVLMKVPKRMLTLPRILLHGIVLAVLILIINTYVFNPREYFFDSPSTNGTIWVANSNIPSSPNWTKIVGGLVNVCYSNGKLVGTNKDGDVYYSPNTSGSWSLVPNKKLQQVSFDGTTLVGVNTIYQQIWRADSNLTSNPNWSLVGGSLANICVSNGKFMGTNVYNTIYYNWSGSWDQLPRRSLKQVSFEISNGNLMCVIGVDTNGSVWYADFTDSDIKNNPNWNNWTPMYATLAYVCISKGKLMGANSNGEIYYKEGAFKGNWQQVTGVALHQLSYNSSDNIIVGINNPPPIQISRQQLQTAAPPPAVQTQTGSYTSAPDVINAAPVERKPKRKPVRI